MRISHAPKINYHLKKVIYLSFLFAIFSANAGSFDDFFKAVRNNQAPLMQSLLQRGFDPNTVDEKGLAGLMLAYQQDALKVVDVLLSWPTTKGEARNAADESVLMLAALKGQLALCRTLIDKGADVNKTGWTPLHYAATGGHLDVIRLLLDESAYIDAESPNGSTPLMMAAGYGSVSAVKLLLEEGADPTLKNQQGMSAWDFARGVNRTDAAAIIAAFMRARQPTGSW